MTTLSQDFFSVIILNYNGWKDTIACLESLNSYKKKGVKVILIDNGSTNESVYEIKKWNAQTNFFGKTSFVTQMDFLRSKKAIKKDSTNLFMLSEENHGFAKGNNLGIKTAEKAGYNHVFLLNNDTVVTSNSLEVLYSRFVINDNQVLTPQIRYFDRPEIIWNCGGKILYPGIRKYYYVNQHYTKIKETKELKISFVTGCALMFNSEKHGLLTEKFFFGEEDMDFSLRMKKSGFKMYCILESIIYHKVGSSLSTNSRKSEIFVLKRLINIKSHYSSFSYFIACILYGINFMKILNKTYSFPWKNAFNLTLKTIKKSNKLKAVGVDLSVHYVRGTSDKKKN